MRCHRCQFENPKEARFCSNCGAELKARETAERRFATVLFADLKEFTTLCEERDPEEVTEIIKELFARFDGILENFRVGYHEYIGDAVLALFGVPTAYGNDAEQAVKAGLAMQEEIKEFVQEIDLNIEMRLGINSGEMIYGEIPGKTTVTGDAVNTTQRLASTAEPGKILISEATAKLVEGRIHTRPLASLKLKGKREKVSAFEIIGPVRKTYPAFLSPMVDRDTELAKLTDIFESNSGLSVTTVAGKVGVGKSRLVFEFQRRLGRQTPQPRVIVTRCTPYRTLVYRPVMDLAGELLGIEKTDSPATVSRKIENHSLVRDPLSNHFLGFFFGLRFPNSPLDHLDPETARRTAFLTLKRLLEQAAATDYLVVVLEDVHYADSGTLDFLEYLVQTDFKGKAMVLLVGRLTGVVEEIRGGKRKGKWNLVELLPLSDSQSRTLITNFFRRKKVPEEAMQVLVQRTEGNPLFIEEFIKEFKENVFVLEKHEASLPDSLWASLEARIDSLASPERIVLRTASVIGRVFWQKLLENLVESNVDKELSVLDRKEFIYAQRPSQFAYDKEYAFGHELLREAAYKTILKKQRRDLHTRILGVLEKIHRENEIEEALYFSLAAHHSECAELYDKAASFYEQSGDNAEKRYAHQEAIGAYTKAMETLAEDVLRRGDMKRIGRLIKKRADLEIFLCAYNEAIADYEKMAKFKDPETKVSGLLGLSETWERKGNPDKSIGYSARAQRISEKKGLVESEAQTCYCIGGAYTGKGLYDEALEFTQKACNIYESMLLAKPEAEELKRLKRWLAKTLNNIGNIHWYRGNYELALDSHGQSLEIAQEIADKNRIAVSLNNIGLVYDYRGDYDTALDFHKRSLEIRRGIGDKHGTAASLNNIGIVYDQLGDKMTALGFYERSIDIYREIDTKDWIAKIMANIGNIHHARGDYDKALESLRQSLKIHEEYEDRQGMVNALTSIGSIHQDLGNYETALTFQKEGGKISREIGARWHLVYCLRGKGVAYNELGKVPQAIESLKEALSICEELKLKGESCETLASLSQILCQTGNTKKAKTDLDKAWKIAEESKNNAAKSNVLAAYVEFHLSVHRYRSAEKCAGELLKLLEKMKWRNFSFAQTLYLRGLALAKLKKREASKKHLSRALSMAKKMKLKSLVARIQASSAQEITRQTKSKRPKQPNT